MQTPQELDAQLAKANATVADLSKVSAFTDIINLSSNLTEGYEGKVSKIGYVATNMDLTNDQTIRNADGSTAFVQPKGEKALSFAIQFEDGKNIAVATAMRSFKSVIGGKAARAYSPAELGALVGKSLKLDSVAKDLSTEQKQYGPADADGNRKELAPRYAKAYSFSVK